MLRVRANILSLFYSRTSQVELRALAEEHRADRFEGGLEDVEPAHLLAREGRLDEQLQHPRRFDRHILAGDARAGEELRLRRRGDDLGGVPTHQASAHELIYDVRSHRRQRLCAA